MKGYEICINPKDTRNSVMPIFHVFSTEESILLNIMMIQDYIQGQKVNFNVICYL